MSPVPSNGVAYEPPGSKIIGLPPLSFDGYAFRHTFAYHFLRKGGTINQLQVLLGHRGIDMTVFMYGSIAAKNTEKTTPYDF
jgi:integrase